MGNQSYAYAMGRIRAVERKMLSRNHFDRMIEAGTADDAFRILHEAEYGSAEAGSQYTALDYERVLDTENEKLAAFISEISPEPRLLNIFLLRYDYHNLKVLLKTEFSGAERGPVLSGSGVFPPDKLVRIVRERALFELPSAMSAGVKDAIYAYQQSVSMQAPDPQSIDIRLDHAMYTHMLFEADELGNTFIKRLIKAYIDLANIGAFIRMREMHKGADFIRGALIPGGDVDLSNITRFLQDSLDGFVGAMRHTPYAGLCDEGVKSYQSTGLLSVFERGADNYINTIAREVKLFSIGLEIIAAYFIARQTELKNVRIVMVGKINGIAQDVIRERLRESYV